MRIKDSGQKLDALQDILDELNTELIKQDIDNASNLLGKKAQKLRDRLKKAKEDLEKIQNTGASMDGNTTQNEEDEFIDALKDEMPEVFKNIDQNFEQLDYIDDLLKQVAYLIGPRFDLAEVRAEAEPLFGIQLEGVGSGLNQLNDTHRVEVRLAVEV